MNNSPKTIFCDIDGTIFKHKSDVFLNYSETPDILNDVIKNIKQWETLNYKIIICNSSQLFEMLLLIY